MNTLCLLNIGVLCALVLGTVPTQATAAPIVKSASQNATYRYAQHHDFHVFYADFQTALKNNDREAVFKMTHMPFVCHSIECGALSRENGEEYDKSQDLSMLNKTEFMQKYQRVFTPRMADFQRPEFMNLSKVDPEDDNSKEFYSPNEQVLQSRYELDSDFKTDFFSFQKNDSGRYQLYQIPYRP